MKKISSKDIKKDDVLKICFQMSPEDCCIAVVIEVAEFDDGSCSITGQILDSSRSTDRGKYEYLYFQDWAYIFYKLDEVDIIAGLL